MNYMQTLTDVRFKLLAFVPTIAGAAVAFFGHGRSAAELLAVGILGLVATFGAFMYELRNSQLYAAVLARARELERLLGLTSVRGQGPGGLARDRPERTVRFAGLVAVGHERALALVYGAALAGWTYLVAWGALRALDVGAARNLGSLIGVAVGLLVIVEVERFGRQTRAAT
jgi:hypothetical protein